MLFNYGQINLKFLECLIRISSMLSALLSIIFNRRSLNFKLNTEFSLEADLGTSRGKMPLAIKVDVRRTIVNKTSKISTKGMTLMLSNFFIKHC